MITPISAFGAKGVEPLNRFERLETIQTRHFHIQRNHVHWGRAQELKQHLRR